MKCLRCGYCCCFLDVVIISPSAIEADGSVDFTNESNYQYKPGHAECPHLRWDGDSAVCGIHDYSWFVDTPCYSHTQVESKDSLCRSGKFFRDNQIDIRERLRKATQTGEGAALLKQ